MKVVTVLAFKQSVFVYETMKLPIVAIPPRSDVTFHVPCRTVVCCGYPDLCPRYVI